MTNKETIEIPFGVKDSELVGFEYKIPEGYEGIIENGVFKLKKAESEDERTLKELIEYAKDKISSYNNMVSGDYDSRDKEDIAIHEWWRKVFAYLEKQKPAELSGDDLSTLQNWAMYITDKAQDLELNDWFVEATIEVVNKMKRLLAQYPDVMPKGLDEDDKDFWLEKQKENPKSADSIPTNCASDAKLANKVITDAIVALSDSVDYNNSEPLKYAREIDALKRLREELKKQKEQPMPSSSELIALWEQEKKVLKERDFRGEKWRLAYNAFLDGFARGVKVKQKEHQICSDAPGKSSGEGLLISPHCKDKNLDDIAQEYVNGVKEYNPTPDWNLVHTAVCYGASLNMQKERTPSTEETELNSIAFLEELGYTCIPLHSLAGCVDDKMVLKKLEASAKEYYKRNYEGGNPQGKGVVIQSYIDGASEWLEKKEQKPDKVSVSEELYEHVRNACTCLDDMPEDHKYSGYYKQAHYDLEEALKMIEKGQKPVEIWPNLSNCIHDCKNCLAKCLHRKEENPEQKPAEWSYPYGKNETVNQLIAIAECLEMDGDCSFNGYKGKDCGKFLREIARREVENKTVELSIEDEFEACGFCYAEEYSDGEYCHEQSFKWGFQEGVDWAINKKVESIKQEWSEKELTDFENAMLHIGQSFFGISAGLDTSDTKVVKEQAKLLLELAPKQEWSDEDEKMRTNTILSLQSLVDEGIHNGFVKSVRKEIYWLKSLHPHWKPNSQELGALRTAVAVLTEERNFPKAAKHIQNIIDAFDGKELRKEWKPSEEQMNELREIVSEAEVIHNGSVGGYSRYIILKSLYEDLKKL